MTAPVVALLVVAYFAIGAAIAGLMDRSVYYPDDEMGPWIAAGWPCYVVVWLLVGVAYLAYTPFRAIYRAVRGKS